MKFNEYEFNRLKYEIRADSIIFTCDAIDGMEKWKNTAAASVINDLLLDFSKGHLVFYKVFPCQVNDDVNMSWLVDPAVILARATTLFNPFYTCLHLSEAKINICEDCIVYFFENDVKWADFLASYKSKSYQIRDLELQKLIKSGKLRAYFEIDDQSDYIFKCNKIYEKRLRQFFEDMVKAGYVIEED